MSEGMSTHPTHMLEAALDTDVPTAGPSSGSMGDGAAGLSLEEAFDVARTAEIVLKGGYKTVSWSGGEGGRYDLLARWVLSMGV